MDPFVPFDTPSKSYALPINAMGNCFPLILCKNTQYSGAIVLNIGNFFGKLVGKMKVKIIGRKIYLPKELIREAKLPENGLCEATVVGDEIRIRRPLSEELNLVKILKSPKTQSIEDMMKAEEVEDV